MNTVKTGRLYAALLILLLVSAGLSAQTADRIEEAFTTAKNFSYHVVLDGNAFADITGEICYEAALGFQLSDGSNPRETSSVFVKKEYLLAIYDSLEQYLTSKDFIMALNPDFRLKDDSSAVAFQSFLYLVDENYFHEGYFSEGNTWYFVRDEFFGELEVWIVRTDDPGRIVSIEHSYDLELELPEEMLGVDAYVQSFPENHELELSEVEEGLMREYLEDRLDYALEIFPVEGLPLKEIWEGDWVRVGFSTEYVEPEGYSYTSTTELFAYLSADSVFLFSYLPDALGFSTVVDTMRSDFILDSDTGVQIFEEALDILLADDAPEKSHFTRGRSWFFIRDEWFDDLEGVVVTLDAGGRISSVYYDYYIAPEDDGVSEEFVEEPFDETRVDWTLHRLEPEAESVRIFAGQGLPVTFEFPADAAYQLGAWIMVLFNGELSGVEYDSEGLWSPFSDWVPADFLPVGEHTISYVLMRPGMNVEEALSRLDIVVKVEPFSAPEGIWDLMLAEPASSVIQAPQGIMVPMTVTFNAEAAREYGVSLAIRHQGVIVDGQNSEYLESPFRITVPAEVLVPGSHVIEVQLLPPGDLEAGLEALASCSLTIEVE